jgi:tetratricopeptide (TPR) repeat protein
LKYGQHFCFPHFDTLIQFCLNLMGKAKDPLVLTGEYFDEGEALRVWETKSLISHLGVLVPKHFMAVYMNDLTLAEKVAAKISAKRPEGKLVPFVLHNHCFLQALTSATLSRTSAAHKKKALELLADLRACAQHCPENYLHRVHLVEAELASSSGGQDDALKKYDLSIELAGQQGIIQEQALATERAGHALCGLGKRNEAFKYFEQAMSLYSQWGCQVKVDQLATSLALH